MIYYITYITPILFVLLITFIINQFEIGEEQLISLDNYKLEYETLPNEPKRKRNILTNFKKMSKDKLAKLGRATGEANRSPELVKAWKDKTKILSAYELGVSTLEIAERYKINRRAVYRILKK